MAPGECRARTGLRAAAGRGRRLAAALGLAGLLLGAEAPGGELQEVPAPVAAPTLDLEDLRGEVHRIEDYRGRVVLVNFWATWCPPCVEELPSLRRLAERMKGRAFALLAVNAGEGKGRIYQFLGTVGRAQFPVLLDPGRKANARWEVRVLPTTYLLDGRGEVRYRAVGALEWDGEEALAAIEALLAGDDRALQSARR